MTAVGEVLALSPGLKGGRGLVHDQRAYLARPGMLELGIVAFADLTPVTPGRDTVIAVAAPGLPRNADVKTCTAQLVVWDADSSASSTTNVAVKKGADAAVPYAITVDAPTRPRNVTLRLEGGEVFWRQGDLTELTYDLPDFAPAVNAYLDKLGAEGDVALRFLLTSDTPGQVGIRRLTFDATRIQTQTWENPADQARRVDRSFEIGFGDVLDADLSPLPEDGSRRRVRALSVDLSGQIDPERSLGNATLDLGQGEFATVGSDFSAAQAVRSGLALACTGAVVALVNTGPASIYAALHVDDDGQPNTATAPVAESRSDLEPGDGVTTWRTLKWDAPATLDPNQRYWLVLRAIQGEAWLAVTRAAIRPLEQFRISRGGAFWRQLVNDSADGACGLVRLLYLPGPENPSSPVDLVLRSAANGDPLVRAPAEPAPQPKPLRIEVPGGGATGGVRLELHASGRGSVTLANLIQEYD